MTSLLRHLGGEGIVTGFLNPGDTGVSVGIKEKSKKAGHEVVVQFTVTEIHEFTVGTAPIAVVPVTVPYFTPGQLFILPAA